MHYLFGRNNSYHGDLRDVFGGYEKCSASATLRRVESRLRAGDRLAWWYRAHQVRYSSRPPHSKSKEVVGLG